MLSYTISGDFLPLSWFYNSNSIGKPMLSSCNSLNLYSFLLLFFFFYINMSATICSFLESSHTLLSMESKVFRFDEALEPNLEISLIDSRFSLCIKVGFISKNGIISLWEVLVLRTSRSSEKTFWASKSITWSLIVVLCELRVLTQSKCWGTYILSSVFFFFMGSYPCKLNSVMAMLLISEFRLWTWAVSRL